MPHAIAHAYLHGFGSGPLATKGVLLAEHYAARGLTLERPDLNRPSFAELEIDAMLAEIDAMHRRRVIAAGSPVRWRFIASSLGGWVASLWAAAHPKCVDRVLLLCPGFHFAERIVDRLPGAVAETWRREGVMTLPDGAGVPTEVHWGLVEGARAHPPAPAPVVPTRILHGRADEVVPIEISRDYLRTHADGGLVELVECEADHRLGEAHAELLALADEFLLADLDADGDRPEDEVSAGPQRLSWDFFGPDAEGTAAHFLRHLDDFLAREVLRGCATSQRSLGPEHAMVCCETPREHAPALGAALRPHAIAPLGPREPSSDDPQRRE